MRLQQCTSLFFCGEIGRIWDRKMHGDLISNLRRSLMNRMNSRRDWNWKSLSLNYLTSWQRDERLPVLVVHQDLLPCPCHLLTKHKICQQKQHKNSRWNNVPFLGAFFALPSWPDTSCSLFSNSCFLSCICSSLDLPPVFLSAKQGTIFSVKTLN